MPAEDYGEFLEASGKRHLEVVGGFHTRIDDKVPPGTRTVLLLGPLEPGFWKFVSAQIEFRDGAPDPLDRWSMRTIGELAERTGSVAKFPFGGPPYHPFGEWALRTGRCWNSPIQFLVHDTSGLMISFRGALCVPALLELPATSEDSPCKRCTGQPCLDACPVGALAFDLYDVDRCRKHIEDIRGQECLFQGCKARRSCPLSKTHLRDSRQSRLHQEAFLRGGY
ncbi:MAG: ferredoxin [Rhodobacteraceae bacterium]|nr:ferredoxin [Paracoccaceae bacterium]